MLTKISAKRLPLSLSDKEFALMLQQDRTASAQLHRKAYQQRDRQALEEEFSQLKEKLAAHKAKGLSLSMARGKPGPELIDQARPLLDVLSSQSDTSDEGVECANYGCLEGIPSARRFMGELLEVPEDQVLVCGQSSLELMFILMMHGVLFGVCGHTPFKDLEKPFKVICPVPGYDRHFSLAERLGAELISLPITEEGLDIEKLKELTKDPLVKALWVVPKYSNPTGISLSEAVCKELVKLEAAPDFRIYWDNAYSEHHLYDEEERRDSLSNIVELAAAAGHPDRIYAISSTSKISFAGSGIAALGSSAANIADIKETLSTMTVGFDKLNQLRHVRFFKNKAGVEAFMKERAALLRPKFELLEQTLQEELDGLGIAEWTTPRGGYFVSLMAYPHTAKRVVALAQECGVCFTDAGASYPYGVDPFDRHIRIAPTFPSLEELGLALDIFCDCLRYGALEQILEKGGC